MRVLAKAYGDKPLDRETTGQRDSVIYLVDKSAHDAEIKADEGVGFPREAVFYFESTLFESLDRAWHVGDSKAVEELWGTATPVDISANVAV